MKQTIYKTLHRTKNNPLLHPPFCGVLITVILFVLAGCTRLDPVVVVITSTATNQESLVLQPTASPIRSSTSDQPTPNATQVPPAVENKSYTVQSGDTLSGIAAKFGVQMQTLLRINQLADPNVLEVGQILNIPGDPSFSSPDFKIISDRRFIRGPRSQQFDVNAFVAQQQGYIRIASDIVDDALLSAIEVIKRVSMEYSVDARLLIAILQYRSHWLTEKQIDDNTKLFPIQGKPSPDGIDRSGLYKQLSWAANQLNSGYYGWKYKALDVIEFDDGTRLRYSTNINAGTIGVQYFFSLQSNYQNWLTAVSVDGLSKLYAILFDNPLADDTDAPVPIQLQQPELQFPFPRGQTWFFTGGPHGGWGSGSAWSAIDFAPPDDRPEGSALCYVSENFGTAVASGVIARSDNGVVILDLDGDGDETTGWTILYLHMASEERVPLGTFVKPGDPVGRPSCEGGFSNATHMHIARRYNGEWLPVSCSICDLIKMPPPFVMSGWTLEEWDNQEYQGYMINGTERRDADQGRLNPDNQITW